VATAFFYGLFFWRTVGQKRGNKVIECAVMAVALLVVMARLSRFIELPDWAFGSLLLLNFLLCIATLFFLAQRAYLTLRQRSARKPTPDGTGRSGFTHILSKHLA
jgi:hypothetical protein